MSSLRISALIVIAVLLAAGGAADRLLRSEADTVPVGSGDSGTEGQPSAAPATARSSAWYCTGATGSPDSAAGAWINIVNAGDRPLTATITVVPAGGDSASTTLDVPAYSRTGLPLTDVVEAEHLAAVVELDGGEAAVELDTSGPLGTSATPCASTASPTWYFAEGVTTRDATETLFVLNPFPEDAVIDMSFATEGGQVTPLDLTGMSVQGGTLAAINVGDFVQRRQSVAGSVVARTGRLVVSRLQTFDGTVGRRGAAVTLGAPSPAATWHFADGLTGEGLTETFQIFNPQQSEAEVELDILLDDGEAEPLLVTVPRESRVSVVANEESRIPMGVGHAVTVRSTNGVDVVVERSLDGQAAAARSGFGSSPGARSPADRWVFAVGRVDESFEEILAFSNPGTSDALVSVGILEGDGNEQIPGLGSVEVPAGGRTTLTMSEHTSGGLPLLISATQPVVAERVYLSKGDGLGLTVTPGIALRD